MTCPACDEFDALFGGPVWRAVTCHRFGLTRRVALEAKRRLAAAVQNSSGALGRYLQLDALRFLEGFDNGEQACGGWIAARTEHALQALRGDLRCLLQTFKGNAGVDIVAQDGLAGVEIAGEKVIDRCGEHGGTKTGVPCARVQTVSRNLRVIGMMITSSCAPWGVAAATLSWVSLRPTQAAFDDWFDGASTPVLSSRLG